MAGPSLRHAAEDELREIQAARAAKKESLSDQEFEVKAFKLMYRLHGDPEKQYQALAAERLCAELRRDLDELDEQMRNAKRVRDRIDGSESRVSGSRYGARTEYSSESYASSSRSSRAPTSTSSSRTETASGYPGRSQAGSYYARRSEAQTSAYYDDDDNDSDDASTVKDFGRSRAPPHFIRRSGTSQRSDYTASSRYPSGSYASSQSSRNDDYPRESYTGRRREPGGFTGPSPLGSSRYYMLRPGVYVELDSGSPWYDNPYESSRPGRDPEPRYEIRTPDGVRPSTASGVGPEYPRQSYGSRARSPSGYTSRSYSTRTEESASQASHHYPPSMDPRSRPGQESRHGSHHETASSRHRPSTARAPPSTVYPGSSVSNAQSRFHSHGEPKRSRQEESRSYASRPSTREHERPTYASDRESKKSRSHYRDESPRPRSRYQESAQSSKSQARTESSRPHSRHTEEPRGTKSTSARQPPRSHAPAAPPSQSAVDAWWKSVNIAFADYCSMQKFPVPPARSCGKMDCEAQKGHRALAACDHGIKNCLIMVKDINLKMERRRWHPDRFAVCPAAKREEFAKMAKEVFCVVEELWKEKN